MRPRRALLCWVLLCAACSGPAARQTAMSPTPASSAEKPSRPYESPARWEVHPAPLSYMTATMRLADGSCLLTEQTGQRWVTWPVHRPLAQATFTPADTEEYDPGFEPESYPEAAPGACSGEGWAAVDRAPEPLVGIVRWPGSFGFIGESGTIHEARSPLGRFTRRIPPPEPLARVRAAGRTLLAVTEAGRALRWQPGAGYAPIDLEGRVAFDLAVSPSGRAVIAAAPEALFTTEDGGEHVTRAAAPSIGVQRVARSPGGSFLVEGAGESLAWDPRGPASFSITHEQIENDLLDVAISVGHGPSASMVTQGRAAIDGDRYWEVSAGEVTPWVLWRGSLDGRLSMVSPAVGAPDDSSVLVAASGSHVALGIVGWDDGVTTVGVRRSHDGGATFGATVPLVLSSFAPLGIAVARDGAVLVTGACRPSGEDGEQCLGGPLLLRGDAVDAPRAPSLRGPAIAPAFSPDGQSAYFLAESEIDHALWLFVSHDGGASFDDRSLEVKAGGTTRSFEAAAETAITVSETGTLGMLVSGGGRDSIWVTTSADGRGALVADPPDEDMIVGGFGERVLAVPRSPEEDGEQITWVWESLDRGVTWRGEKAPEILRGSYRRPGDVACGLSGCLIGGDVSRIGWDLGAPSPVPFKQPAPPEPPRELRTAIVCEPRAGASWTHVDHVHRGDVLPRPSDAARGRAAWTIVTYDPSTGASGFTAAMMPASGDGDARITTKQLFAPVARGARLAFAHRPQIEGEAMARAKLAPAGAGAGQRLVKDVEIAWENFEEGTTGHATLADAGVPESSMVIERMADDRYLHMDVLSISPKGIFVRATAAGAMSFMEPSGKARLFDPPPWPESVTRGAEVDPGDALNVDGTFVMTTTFDGRSDGMPEALLLGRPPEGTKAGDPWTPFAVTVAPPSTLSLQASMGWTYEGGHLAVRMSHAAPATGTASAWIARVLAGGTLGAWSRMPTPYDLPAAPRGCTAAEHRDLPRIVADSTLDGLPACPGTRHPVLIAGSAGTERIEQVAMLSSGVVLRGTPASPCVDAFVARRVGHEQSGAVILGDLRQGWFFRKTLSRTPPPRAAPADETTPFTAVDVYPLVCRFDPSVPVPTSVIEENAGP